MTDAPSAPAGRQVVVVRAGPPKKRGPVVDAIIGILGVALLVMAGVLGETLPEEEFIPKQYLPDYPDNNTAALFSSDGQLTESVLVPFMRESETVELPFEVAHDNVFSIQLSVAIEGDDIAASLPDTFTFQVYDHEGELITTDALQLSTEAPREREVTNPDYPLNATMNPYIAQRSSAAQTFRFSAPPDPEFISGKDKDIDRVTALRFAIENHTVETEGTWKLVVSMKTAGDCPQPGTSTDDSQKASACQRETEESNNPQEGGARGQDLGNEVTIRGIRYDYYTIEIPEPTE